MLTEMKLRELIRKAESATPGPWANERKTSLPATAADANRHRVGSRRALWRPAELRKPVPSCRKADEPDRL